jgi:hypothetical protein
MAGIAPFCHESLFNRIAGRAMGDFLTIPDLVVEL